MWVNAELDGGFYARVGMLSEGRLLMPGTDLLFTLEMYYRK
jgi:hypothetical protein